MSTLLFLLALGTLPCVPPEAGFEPSHRDALLARECEPGTNLSLPIPPPPAAEAPAAVAVALSVPPAAPARPRLRPTALPAAGETTRYRVVYGVLGELGEVKISFQFPGSGVRATGFGAGSLFGLGKIEKRVDAELGPDATTSRRWVTTRVQSGKIITDTIDQPSPGEIAVVRQRSDRPQEGHHFSRQSPVLDPLAFLWRLRRQPPTHSETFEVLDGRALWLITMAATRTEHAPPARSVLVLAGQAEPVFWNGKPDDDRSARKFTLWLEGDEQHTPLRLVMPLALGEVRVDLTSVSHLAPTAPPAPRGETAADGRAAHRIAAVEQAGLEGVGQPPDPSSGNRR